MYPMVMSDAHVVGAPKIPTFNGEPGTWVGFALAFNEAIVKRVLSNSLRLLKLLEYTGPIVQAKIKIFQHDTIQGFDRAMKCLWEIYGHPALVITEIVEGLTVGQAVIRARDRVGLLHFHHQVRCAIETVQVVQAIHSKELNYDYLSSLDNPDVLIKLLKRMPEQMATMFVDRLAQQPGSVRQLSDFLEEKTKSGAHPLHISLLQGGMKDLKLNDSKSQHEKKKSVFMTTVDVADKVEEPSSREAPGEAATGCPSCRGSHDINDCKRFNESSPARRRSILSKANYCFNC